MARIKNPKPSDKMVSKLILLSLLKVMCVILGIKIAESFFVTCDMAEFCFVHAL